MAVYEQVGRALPNDRRGFIFSCSDAGGFDWQNDWFWRLTGQGGRYDEIGLDVFKTIDFNRAHIDEPEVYFSVGLRFNSNGQTCGRWNNIKFDLRLADLLRFSSPKWPFSWLSCESRIVSVLPNTVVWEFKLTPDESLKPEQPNVAVSIYSRPVTGNPTVAEITDKALTIGNADKQLSAFGEGFSLSKGEYSRTFACSKPRIIRLVFSTGSKDTSPYDSIRKAQEINLDAFESRVMEYYNGLPEISTGRTHWDRLFYKVFDDKRLNILQHPEDKNCLFECPDRPRHNSLWLWDTCFSSLVWNNYKYKNLHLGPLQALLSLQDPETGYVPITFGYEGERSQPPIISWVLNQIDVDIKTLGDLYPKLVKFHNWWFENRKVSGTALCSWKEGGESGLDNAPLWDNQALNHGLLCADLNAQLVLDAECLASIARKLGLDEDVAKWHSEREHLAGVFRKTFWDEKHDFFYNRFLAGETQRIKTLTSYWVLTAGIANNQEAESMLKYLQDPQVFKTPFPCPSVAANESSFEMDYWRGPVWIHSNYVVIKGLERYGFTATAKDIAERTIDMVARDYERTGYLWECYDPFTGSGEYVGKKKRGPRQIADYFCGWTGLVADLMLHLGTTDDSRKK